VPLPDLSRCSKLSHLLKHLVSALLKQRWHVEAERLGSLEIDNKLEFDWNLDGKLARIRAFE